jgi:hypothetical protein
MLKCDHVQLWVILALPRMPQSRNLHLLHLITEAKKKAFDSVMGYISNFHCPFYKENGPSQGKKHEDFMTPRAMSL